MLELPADQEGVFLERPNRFLALVDGNGKTLAVHVHDPGRLPDVLIPGNRVLLKYRPGPKRKTAWDLLAGWAANHWVFAHSGYHRPLSEAILTKLGKDLFPGLKDYLPEPKINTSRLDYLFEMEKGPKVYVEIKGCTWAKGETALFPDAPTSRGQRHLSLLADLKRKGFRSLLWVLCFRKEASCFRPAQEIDPAFARLFEEAQAQGVELKISKLCYDGQKIYFQGEIPPCAG